MKRLSLIIVSTVFFAGCSTVNGPISSEFGKTVAAANDQQVVTKTATPGAPAPDAQVQSNAVTRYRTDFKRRYAGSDFDLRHGLHRYALCVYRHGRRYFAADYDSYSSACRCRSSCTGCGSSIGWQPGFYRPGQCRSGELRGS